MPRDFYTMTPAELYEQIDAYDEREEQSWRKLAWQTAYLLNIHLKDEDKVTIDDLLKIQKPKEPQTVETQVQVIEMWVAALGGEDRRGVH